MKILRKEYKDFLKKKTPGDYAGGIFSNQSIEGAKKRLKCLLQER